jgi:spore maturation protein CgeB
MKIVIFGLAITSSWGNGHATTYRALVRALQARGHQIDFFERDLEWYRNNRDLAKPEFCRVHIYEDWAQVVREARRELRDADLAIVGSYAPDALAATREVFDSAAAVKAFYDIDTPITVAALRECGATEYINRALIPGFDLYLSFTGGPMLRELERMFGARRAAPMYCSFDPQQYHPRPPSRRYRSDMSYMGTYAPDRQPKIDELLSETARRLPEFSFLVAGPQYPKGMRWPGSVRRIVHLNPRWHPLFYSSSRLTLNVTRRDMVQAGYSPSVRLFEAAACGVAIASDNWPGLDSFLDPGREVLLPASADDVVRYLRDIDAAELRRIGLAARERMMAEHTSERRAQQLEQLVESACGCVASPDSVQVSAAI